MQYFKRRIKETRGGIYGVHCQPLCCCCFYLLPYAVFSLFFFFLFVSSSLHHNYRFYFRLNEHDDEAPCSKI